MRILLLMLCLAPLSAMAEVDATHTDEHWSRLQRMVRVGIITPEAAKNEKIHANVSGAKRRSDIQRGLASVTPALHPIKIERIQAPVIEVFVD